LPALDELLKFDLLTFGQIILIDLTLSGDNAIIIGLAAAGLPPHQRRLAIVWGIIGATLLRILFASMTYVLLEIVGLTLAGGILLLWVTHKMWRETRHGAASAAGPEEGSAPKTMRGAITSILIADVSMSLDNVLAVAGAAHDYPGMLIFGLVLSIALMALAANLVAKLLEDHRWLAYLGIAVVAYVALDMIWRGMSEVWSVAASAV
jgi:YjbE family integral membrane protein